MGRITIFSSNGCVHTRRVKAELDKHTVPYTEINITDYPEKRKDMLALSDHMGTPQVFFSNRYVGGADETILLLKQWDDDKTVYRSVHQRYYLEIARMPQPRQERFAIPDNPPAKPEPRPPRGDKEFSVLLPDASRTSVLEITETLKKILTHSEHAHRLTAYSHSFLEQDAIKALKERFKIRSTEAAEFGKRLQSLQIIHCVYASHGKTDFGGSINDPNKKAIFRLQCFHLADILNSYRVWTEKVDPQSMRLVSRLQTMLEEIKDKRTDDKGFVDYKNAQGCRAFAVFEEAVCELQKVNLSMLKEKELVVSQRYF